MTGGRIAHFLPVCLLALGVGGCAWFGDKPVEVPAPLAKIADARRVNEVWDRDTGKGAGKLYLKLAPAPAGDTIYAADVTGRVRAYDARNGRAKWTRNLKRPLTSGVAVSESRMLAATIKGDLYALDAATGKIVWQTPVGSELLMPAAVAGETAVVQGVDGRLVALSVSDGKILWTQERSEPALSLRGSAPPHIDGDKVIAGFASGKLAAHRLSDGAVIWETAIADARGRSEVERLVDIDGNIVIAAGVVYCAAYQGNLAAVNADTGRILWSREVSSYTGVGMNEARIFITDEKGVVMAFDASNGATVWQQEGLRYRGLSAPAVSGDAIVVGDGDGYVHWLATDDGRFLARARTARAAYLAAPAVSGDMVFVAARNGDVDALRLR